MAIVLPPITAWAKGHLASILTATTTTDFNSAFDAFLSKHATITVNGQHVSRDQYKQQLLGESTVGNLKQSTSIEFNGVVEVPTDQEQLVKVFLPSSRGRFMSVSLATKCRLVWSVPSTSPPQISEK